MPGTEAAVCYFCGGTPAVVYCRADAAGLCLPCDRYVHGANRVSSRHAHAPLCAACRAAAAASLRHGVDSAVRFLCSSCDLVEEGQHRGSDRGTVEGYTGCPSVAELAAIFGDKQPAADEGYRLCRSPLWDWERDWEGPQVLALDDVMLPISSCHGLLTSSSPKNGSWPCAKLDGEVLRQLGELAKSEAAGGDELPLSPRASASSDYAFGHAHLGAAEAICHGDSEAARSLEAQYEALATADCAVPRPPDGDHPSAPVAQAAPPQADCKDGVVVYPDRGAAILRYKEKRKRRVFGKRVRYELLKARADARTIKGRFAKSS